MSTKAKASVFEPLNIDTTPSRTFVEKPAPANSTTDTRKTITTYLPHEAHECLRQIAFNERVKMNDLMLEGIDHVLAKHGFPSIAEIKAKAKAST